MGAKVMKKLVVGSVRRAHNLVCHDLYVRRVHNPVCHDLYVHCACCNYYIYVQLYAPRPLGASRLPPNAPRNNPIHSPSLKHKFSLLHDFPLGLWHLLGCKWHLNGENILYSHGFNFCFATTHFLMFWIWQFSLLIQTMFFVSILTFLTWMMKLCQFLQG